MRDRRGSVVRAPGRLPEQLAPLDTRNTCLGKECIQSPFGVDLGADASRGAFANLFVHDRIRKPLGHGIPGREIGLRVHQGFDLIARQSGAGRVDVDLGVVDLGECPGGNFEVIAVADHNAPGVVDHHERAKSHFDLITCHGDIGGSRSGNTHHLDRDPGLDRQQIEERFKELGLNLDWSKLQELARIRNDVEHLFMTVKPAIAKEALASAMPVIEQLLVEHLQEDPAHLFRDGVWKALLENKDVLDQQQARCIESFQNMNWEFDTLFEAASELRCSICGSSLVRQINPDNQSFEAMEIDCAECGAVLDREEVFEAAIGEATAGDAYIAITDGGEPPLTTCPECHRESWVNGEGCVLCPGADLTCSMCGEQFNPDDFNYDAGMCSYCAWRMDKVMRE